MKPERILPQQLMAACGQYVEAKAAAIELNNLYVEIECLTSENESHKKTIESLRVYRDILAEIIDAMVASGRQAE